MQQIPIVASFAAALLFSGGADMPLADLSAIRTASDCVSRPLLAAAPLLSAGADMPFVGMSAIRAASDCASRPLLAAAPLPTPTAQETMNFTVEGKISKHTEQKLTLSTEGNIIFHVVYSEKTSITRKDGSAGTAKDLRVGTRIHVDGELTEAGEIIAQKITLQSESPGEKR